MSMTEMAVDPAPPPTPAGTPRRLGAPWLSAPAMIFVALGLLAPLALMLRNSLNRYDPAELMISAVTAENYIKFFGDAFYQEVLWRTIGISALSTAICLAAGIPLAYFLARHVAPGAKRALLLAILVPLLIGNAVRTSAWMLILNDQGVLAAFLRLFGWDGQLGLMYSSAGVTIGLVSVLLPFMVITLNSVFESIDQNLEDAGQSLGAGHLTVMRRIVLPLAMPGILAGSVLCFILSMNAYATPVLIGGPTFHMMAPTVYQQIAKVMNWPFGAALAFILMAVTLILTVGVSVLVQRRYRKWSE
ncbi:MULTISPECIES: ABC transporter permease [Paracoccus]|uniref:ABC transporter permease n=3 Tax=Paracoccus TaxID=265 RepID=A0A5P2QRT3_9RHOB|nr:MULTISPECIES: ABC transporter permease [Paracoccus]MBY0134759.1 ABC transporter permease [Paracoccus yeei]MTH66155.1 ABC transporter permease subunit [Paracoccus shanxieyensis]MTH89418.1 ABC transporter permease subunit [Paracoccus shanxieyensis]OWJ95867.1 ABC transporter permease [Paracoccus yeei]QEU08605.1 ABC transporter permease [Paracoccus yeei]